MKNVTTVIELVTMRENAAQDVALDLVLHEKTTETGQTREIEVVEMIVEGLHLRDIVEEAQIEMIEEETTHRDVTMTVITAHPEGDDQQKKTIDVS